MSRPGPPRTPTPILDARGSRVTLYDRGDEPIPDRTRPTCPTWLRKEGKRAWREIIPQLDDMGVLGKCDRNALARYCQTWARWREADDWLKANENICTSIDAQGNTVLKPHPYVGVASTLSEQLLRLEKQFGLTPSARAGLAEPKVKNPHENRGKAGLFE